MCSTHANFLKCQAKTGPAVIQKSVRPSSDIFAPVCHGLDRPGCRAAMWLVRALGQCAVPALARQCAARSPFSGELEADESSFGPQRIRGKRGCDGLVDLGLDKHFRLNHGSNEFVKGCRHVNGIESFWPCQGA